MTQSSRSNSSISPTNSRSSTKRYKLSPTREREIAKRRARWLEEKRLDEIHNKRKEEFIAKFDMERKKKDEEERRRRRHRSSRENRRDISPAVAGTSNESQRPRTQPTDNRQGRSDSPVAGTSNEVTRRGRDSHSLVTDVWNALSTIYGSSQSPSRNDHLQGILNSPRKSILLRRFLELLPNFDCNKEADKILFCGGLKELLNQLQQEEDQDVEPDRRPPSPQGRRPQPSTSGYSRPLPVRGSERSSRERSPRRARSPRRESSHDRTGHRSRSRSRHRRPHSRDSNYRRSNQEVRSQQRSPRSHLSSREHEQHRQYRRPRSPQERVQRDGGEYSMESLPPHPHQHSSAPPLSDYPAPANLEEYQLLPPRPLHPYYLPIRAPPIGPPPGPWYRCDDYSAYGQPIEHLSRYMVGPHMVPPEFRHPRPFPNWRAPRPPPQNIRYPSRYHGNRFRHPRPNLPRGNQQAPDTTQRTDANPTTSRPPAEEDNNTKNQDTSKK